MPWTIPWIGSFLFGLPDWTSLNYSGNLLGSLEGEWSVGYIYAHYPDFAWIEATVLGLGRPIRSYPKLPGRQKIVENHVVIGSCHRYLPWLNSSFLCGVCWHSYFVLNPTLVHYSWRRLNQIPSFNWQNWKVSSWSSSPHLTAFFLPLAKKAPLIAAESRYQGIYHVLSAHRIPFWAVGFHSNNIAKYCKNRWGSPDISFSFALMLIRIAFSLDSKVSHSFCLMTFIYLRLTRIVALWTFSSSYIQLPTLQEEHTTICASSRCNLGHSKRQCSKFWADWLPARLQIHPRWQQSRETASEIRLNWRWAPGKKINQTRHNFFQHRHHIILLKGCWTPKAERTIFTMNSIRLSFLQCWCFWQKLARIPAVHRSTAGSSLGTVGTGSFASNGGGGITTSSAKPRPQLFFVFGALYHMTSSAFAAGP